MKKIFLIALLVSKLFDVHAQNVGIGTTNPIRAKLEVNGVAGNGATSAIFGGESTGISLQRNWPGIGFNQYYNGVSRYIANGFAAVQFIDPNTGYMAIDMFGSGAVNSAVSSSRRAMVIANEGRVTIGSGDYPPATLYVARGTAVDGTAVFQGTAHRSHFNYGENESTHIRAGKNNGTVFINDIPGAKIALSGYVGINTATPNFPLEVRQLNQGGILLVNPVTFQNWEQYIFPGSGSLELNFGQTLKGFFSSSNGSYNTVSDRRLKNSIQALPLLLDKVMQLEPVEYEMNDHNPNHEKTIGFIAQDVKKLFPDLVTVRSDTAKGYKDIPNLHTINYTGFGAIAIKAIQEQQEIIKSLQKSVHGQQQYIQSQQVQINKLMKVVDEILNSTKSN